MQRPPDLVDDYGCGFVDAVLSVLYVGAVIAHWIGLLKKGQEWIWLIL
jgi:hypothetical protein